MFWYSIFQFETIFRTKKKYCTKTLKKRTYKHKIFSKFCNFILEKLCENLFFNFSNLPEMVRRLLFYGDQKERENSLANIQRIHFSSDLAPVTKFSNILIFSIITIYF